MLAEAVRGLVDAEPHVLEHPGPAFKSGAPFVRATRQYLCVALLQNEIRLLRELLTKPGDASKETRTLTDSQSHSGCGIGGSLRGAIRGPTHLGRFRH